jgi:hypothetical protein
MKRTFASALEGTGRTVCWEYMKLTLKNPL